jgi:hypothetical protein
MRVGRDMRPSHEELQARVDAYIEQFDASVADEKDQRLQQKGQVCIYMLDVWFYVVFSTHTCSSTVFTSVLCVLQHTTCATIFTV